MEIWKYIESSVSRQQTFDNYINDQPAVRALKTGYMDLPVNTPTVISGTSGNGVTHLLHAICNKWTDKGRKVFCIGARSMLYILKKIKGAVDFEKFRSHLLSFDLLAIDSVQHFYRKSSRYTNFIFDLLKKCTEENKPVIMGCSEPKKDFTKSRSNSISINRIHLHPISGLEVFRILKHLCEYERRIPESLLYAISSYNGSVSEYINCLVSIRFKTKSRELIIPDTAPDELDNLFNLKSYFPKQQFRRCLASAQLDIWTKTDVKMWRCADV